MVDTVRPSATYDGLRQFYYGSVRNGMPLVVEFDIGTTDDVVGRIVCAVTNYVNPETAVLVRPTVPGRSAFPTPTAVLMLSSHQRGSLRHFNTRKMSKR